MRQKMSKPVIIFIVVVYLVCAVSVGLSIHTACSKQTASSNPLLDAMRASDEWDDTLSDDTVITLLDKTYLDVSHSSYVVTCSVTEPNQEPYVVAFSYGLGGQILSVTREVSE